VQVSQCLTCHCCVCHLCDVCIMSELRHLDESHICVETAHILFCILSYPVSTDARSVLKHSYCDVYIFDINDREGLHQAQLVWL